MGTYSVATGGGTQNTVVYCSVRKCGVLVCCGLVYLICYVMHRVEPLVDVPCLPPPSATGLQTLKSTYLHFVCITWATKAKATHSLGVGPSGAGPKSRGPHFGSGGAELGGRTSLNSESSPTK